MVIDQHLSIPDDELSFTVSRSGGPGGQHVNKTSTRVTLLFDVVGSPSLDDDQKRRLRARLSTRINREGVLRVVCQATRSQAANREIALERFAELLREALRPPRRRGKTRVPAAERRRRVDQKRRRGQVKRHRRRPAGDD